MIHDCLIEDDVTMSSNAAAAGNVIIMRGANLGINAAIHQFGNWLIFNDWNECLRN